MDYPVRMVVAAADVPMHRLHDWLKRRIFDSPKWSNVGQGRERRFTFVEVCNVRVFAILTSTDGFCIGLPQARALMNDSINAKSVYEALANYKAGKSHPLVLGANGGFIQLDLAREVGLAFEALSPKI